MQKQKLLEQQEQQLLRQKQLQHEEQQQQQQQLQQQQILLQQQIMQEKQKLQQQLELERQKQQLKQQQEFEKQRQLELQQKQFAANSVQGWQTQQLQSQMTGQNFAHSPYYQQPMNAVSVPLSSVLPQPLIPSPTAAGQHMQRTGYGSGLQRSQTMGSGIASQPTGVRNWQTATPENPFGSPSMSPLSPQMTGVQFSTPNPNAFNYNPVQSPQANYLQPQLTGFPVQQQPQQTGNIYIYIVILCSIVLNSF
ncbi:hypothetical protein J3Q64DRAFT_1197011 [Phycomyces blakesleeanus]|uniref:Uncharacterized protein n=1 Tax=Phycomyces blakesleeanus TaxID=4837 RepID=A0ABR3AR07_PHYBL